MNLLVGMLQLPHSSLLSILSASPFAWNSASLNPVKLHQSRRKVYFCMAKDACKNQWVYWFSAWALNKRSGTPLNCHGAITGFWKLKCCNVEEEMCSQTKSAQCLFVHCHPALFSLSFCSIIKNPAHFSHSHQQNWPNICTTIASWETTLKWYC